MLSSQKLAVALALLAVILPFVVEGRIRHKFGHKKFRPPPPPESFGPAPHIHSKFAYVTWSNDTGYDIKVWMRSYLYSGRFNQWLIVNGTDICCPPHATQGSGLGG